MDKKFNFSDQPTKVKIIYGAVIAILCISAIVVGIVSVASTKKSDPDTEPPITDNVPKDEVPNEAPDTNEDENKAPEKTSLTSPVIGEVVKNHSLDTPVFSTTLNEWRVHTGIDISAELGDKVYAGADGEVTNVYYNNYYGRTVEITHPDGVVSVYSNLDGDNIAVSVGQSVKRGDVIGLVGDTSLTELADEAHLHFEVRVSGKSVNPLDYISEESKEASLGINGV
ncbi:MAG: M23 family metallopeptidase [Clostridia bacterium]|nr:M23 family metallopeptidase [Clostridia bacterium]